MLIHQPHFDQPMLSREPVPLEERRASERIRTVFCLAKIAREDDVGLWRVRNLSDAGMMLCTGAAPSRGERLSVALSDHAMLSGRVAWSDPEHCGITFDEPVCAEDLLNRLALERRSPGYREPRLEVRRCAVAYSECGIRPVRVANISPHGVGFAHDGHFHPGLHVKLLMHGEEHRGVIRWSNASQAGVLLTEPFSFTALESMTRF